jgi:hypothetical protein
MASRAVSRVVNLAGLVQGTTAVTAEGEMERYLVDRLLVRRERYDSVQ